MINENFSIKKGTIKTVTLYLGGQAAIFEKGKTLKGQDIVNVKEIEAFGDTVVIELSNGASIIYKNVSFQCVAEPIIHQE